MPPIPQGGIKAVARPVCCSWALDSKIMEMTIDQLSFTLETRLFPIIGCPMGQSSASYAYNPLFSANGIDEIMWPVEIPVGGLGDFMGAARTLGIKHFCLTMPHKTPIIHYLDEVDERSRIFNSVNVVKMEKGKSIGSGMDGKGNIAAIKAAGVDVGGMHIVIIGAGSIVGVILLELASEGAGKVTLINRSVEKADALVRTVREYTDMTIECLPLTGDNLNAMAGKCDFLMQSTPLGLAGYPHDFSCLDFIDRLDPRAIVMENIVNPPLTGVARRARERGLKVIYGMDMMLGQIGKIFEFCYGFAPKPEHIESARRNVRQFFNFWG
jgi:shikimate dehydrogenase